MRLLSALLRPAASFALVTTTSTRISSRTFCLQRRRRFVTASFLGDHAHHRSSSSISTTSTSLRAGGGAASENNNKASVAAPATTAAAPSILHSSFAEIVDLYDAFILDQFGVLHNGVEALEGAIELVSHLHAQNKKLIILSNTSAPAQKALAKLPTLGFAAEHFVDAVTSGEEASRYIRKRYSSSNDHDDHDRDDDSTIPRTTTKALFWTWDAIKPNNPRLTAPPQAFLDQCGANVQVTAEIGDADLLLLHGSEVWYRGTDVAQEPLGTFIETGDFAAGVDPLLQRCVERRLPMICANPDFQVVTPTGGAAYMPGKIAQRYRDLLLNDGASHDEISKLCKVFGKPDTEHFEACLRTLGMTDQRHRVAHVGDSLSHDVAGAASANIPTVFVTSGIHARQLNTTFGEMPTNAALDELFRDEAVLLQPPTHVVSTFRL